MGRQEDFRVFFETHLDGLRRLALRLTGNRAEAEDLAQEAMVRTYRAWRRIRETDRPELYARAALVNRHRSLRRRALVEAKHLLIRRDPVNELGVDANALAVWTEVLDLPVKQRQAVVLHYYEGLPQTEIARMMRVADGTVSSLVHRALRRLRARLADEETERTGS